MIIDVYLEIFIRATDISINNNFAMADSIIYFDALKENSVLLILNNALKNLKMTDIYVI